MTYGIELTQEQRRIVSPIRCAGKRHELIEMAYTRAAKYFEMDVIYLIKKEKMHIKKQYAISMVALMLNRFMSIEAVSEIIRINSRICSDKIQMATKNMWHQNDYKEVVNSFVTEAISREMHLFNS